MKTTDRANVFANTFHGDKDTLYIYSDGYIVSKACSQAGVNSIRKMLEEEFPNVQIEEARSDDGFLSVWVIPCDMSNLPFKEDELQWSIPPVFMAITESYGDNRWSDWGTLDLAADLFLAAK